MCLQTLPCKMSEKQSVMDVVEDYCTQLRRRAIQGSLPCAKRTAEIMRILVTSQRHTDAAALIDSVRSTGHTIQSAKPVELAIGNIVRRVLHLIREEAQNEALANEAEAEEDTAGMSNSSAAAMEIARQELSRAQGGPGLLTQALKTSTNSQAARSMFASRTLSLSNLLDVGLVAMDVQPTAQPADVVIAPPAQLQGLHAAADTEVESQASYARGPMRASKKALASWSRKHVIIDAINEMIEELDNITSNITDQGVEHLHANEVILTLGLSNTACAFLTEASKKREFQVIVAEGAPQYGGHVMARRLAEAGIQTTVIADSAVFAMMARANKVIVGAHAVLANGGVVARCGIHMVALAARQFSIPFVVLVGLHKLSPLFPHQPEVGLNEFGCPAEILDLDMLADVFAVQAQLDAAEDAQQQTLGKPPQAKCRPDPLAGTLHVPNPGFDYIPPDLISLFITDTGGYTPSYVYRLLTEYYSREDYLLSKELLVRHN